MSKLYLDSDEWYPVYDPILEKDADRYTRQFEPLVEIDAATARRWRRTMRAFRQVQEEMGEVYDANRKPVPTPSAVVASVMVAVRDVF